mmetsp:Transcript_28606/g.80618  ORF Transcript_28606/g.80618 Transcript_28606/m.80618 type:complete len:315 (+) Transcript_28606:532-1476(+)
MTPSKSIQHRGNECEASRNIRKKHRRLSTLPSELLPNSTMATITTITLMTVIRCISNHQSGASIQLELLHCVENNNVVGGASTLIDAMAAAQEFAKLRPAHFELLCTYQASFIKQRDGAQMARYIPHIQTAPKTMMPTQDDANGRIGNSWVQDVEVVAVHWSPPFEGPLVHVPPQMMASFQDAYKAFSLMLDSSMHDDREEKPDFGDDIDDDIDDAHRRLDEDELRQYAKKYTWEYTLCKGDVLLFNNQRMLHGRRRFELLEGNNHLDAPGCRHLIGCYTNVDETSSGWSMLRRAFGVTEDSLHPNVGNGSSAR